MAQAVMSGFANTDESDKTVLNFYPNVVSRSRGCRNNGHLDDTKAIKMLRETVDFIVPPACRKMGLIEIMEKSRGGDIFDYFWYYTPIDKLSIDDEPPPIEEDRNSVRVLWTNKEELFAESRVTPN